jgi:hypothetical protein
MKEQELREEYKQKYYDNDFDSGALELPDPDLEADFWLSKREAEWRELRKNIEDLVPYKTKEGYEIAKKHFLQIIDEKLK